MTNILGDNSTNKQLLDIIINNGNINFDLIKDFRNNLMNYSDVSDYNLLFDKLMIPYIALETVLEDLLEKNNDVFCIQNKLNSSTSNLREVLTTEFNNNELYYVNVKKNFFSFNEYEKSEKVRFKLFDNLINIINNNEHLLKRKTGRNFIINSSIVEVNKCNIYFTILRNFDILY